MILKNNTRSVASDWAKEDWANDFCAMEMRLKIVEAIAEHDFV